LTYANSTVSILKDGSAQLSLYDNYDLMLQKPTYRCFNFVCLEGLAVMSTCPPPSGGNEEAINNNENSLFFEAKNIQHWPFVGKFIWEQKNYDIKQISENRFHR
jgi:hypothetical protein